MILIVEDDPRWRTLLARTLLKAGYEVVEAEDGGEAVKLIDSRQFDLVITDLALPVTTGVGVIRHARSKWPQMPIILMSGYLSKDAAEKIFDYRVEFISKPVDRALLLAMVGRLAPLLGQ